MSTTWLLIKTQFQNLFFSSRKGKDGKKGIAVIIPAAAMLYIAIAYNGMLYNTIPPSLYYIVPFIMLTVGFVMIFILSVNSAQGQLFGYKDYDVLMSLPVTSQEIVTSKIATFFLMQYLYALFLIVPTIIMYGVSTHASALSYVAGFIGFLVFPAIPSSLAALIALGIRKITSKMKHKNLFNNLFQIIFIVAVFISAFSIGFYGDNNLVMTQALNSAYQWIAKFLIPIAWYGNSFVYMDWISLIAYIGINILAFLLLILFFSRSFLRVNEVQEQGYHVKNFHAKETKRNSVFMALLKKEYRKFFSNFMYVMNSEVGMVMVVVGAIFAVIKKDAIMNILTIFGIPMAQISTDIGIVLFLVMGFCGHINCSTCCSISLEGKQLWIIKSSPIGTMQLFWSKILVNLLNTLVPELFATLLLAFAFAIPWNIVLLGIVYLIACALFVSVFGLVVNLALPKLDFDREVVVIKQSAAVMVTVLVGMLIGGAIMIFGIINLDSSFGGMTYFVIVMIGYLLADLFLYIYLKHEGTKQMNRLA